MKPLIIGQAPGRSAQPGERALEGESKNGAGARLARCMGLESPARLFELFDTVNLLECWPGSKGAKGDAFPRASARMRAQTMVFPNRVIILLGRNVASAFDRADAPALKWMTLAGRMAGIVPHPSGIVLWWNSSSNAEAAAAFLWSAVDVAKLATGRADPSVEVASPQG